MPPEQPWRGQRGAWPQQVGWQSYYSRCVGLRGNVVRCELTCYYSMTMRKCSHPVPRRAGTATTPRPPPHRTPPQRQCLVALPAVSRARPRTGSGQSPFAGAAVTSSGLAGSAYRMAAPPPQRQLLGCYLAGPHIFAPRPTRRCKNRRAAAHRPALDHHRNGAPGT